MSSNDQRSDDRADRGDIAPPDPTAGQPGDGPTQGGSTSATSTAGGEGEGADKSTDR